MNEVICHGIPDQRPLKDGDIVNLDISCFYDGYHGDLNATYLVGNVDEKGRKLVDTARECLQKAIDMGKWKMTWNEKKREGGWNKEKISMTCIGQC